MPELPEVETVRRQLDARLRGVKIKQVELIRTAQERPKGQLFVDALVGQRIRSVDRRAKLLIWRLETGQAILAHLKMTGRFLFVDKDHTAMKHDAIRFTFEDQQGEALTLMWNDVRKFGYMEVVSAKVLEETLAAYGPEPLEVATGVLAECLRLPKARVLKAALLNQACIAGIGNIYADEACHRAGIHPKRRLGTLSEMEREKLAGEIQAVLREALDQQGTSAHTYVDTMGSRGGFLSFLRVYGRTGEPCRACGAKIQKTRLVQRGTHVCPHCQREEIKKRS